MTDRPFDKFIKEKLNDYSLPVSEDLWEKIQQKNNKKVESFFWWKNYGFITLIGVAALLTCTIILLTANNASQSAKTKELSVTKNTNSQSSAAQLKDNSAAAANKTADNLTINERKAFTKENKRANTFNSNSFATYHNQSNDRAGKIFLSKIHNKRAPSFVEDAFAINGHHNNESTYSSFDKENNALSIYKPVLTATAKQDKNLSNYSPNDQLLNGKGLNLFCLDDCPSTRGPVKNNVYLEIFGSPDYAKKTINNSGGVDETFLRRKDSSESGRLSFTAGFRLTKTLGENFLIKAGLQYSQINEKFSYRSENERNQTTVITIRKILLTTGDTLMVRDTSTIVQIGYRIKTSYNHYRSIDVPLIAGYQWGNDNLKASVSAGVILNLYSWQKGESLDTSYVPVEFNKNGDRTFKRNIGVGLFTGFSVLKKAGKSTWLFAEPYLRYNVSNITNNKSIFNQKFDVAGLNIGIRYKLNSEGQQHFTR